jgi:large subunit ribosomal protein LP0
LLEKYDRAFICHADNVGSMQFQNIRKASWRAPCQLITKDWIKSLPELIVHYFQGLRPDSVILMGKNTMMKRSIRLWSETSGSDKWSCLLEQLVGNVGVVFTTADLNDVKAEINKYMVGAPARVGLTAPNDVKIPAGPTGMDPSQTSFFQVRKI